MYEGMAEKIFSKMKRKDIKDRHDQIKAKIAKEINMLRKKEHEDNLKMI